MANLEHVKILKQGANAWNEWRAKNPNLAPDLIEADLNQINLKGANLSKTRLFKAHLFKANLQDADLTEADLGLVDLAYGNLMGANLRKSTLYKAVLYGTNLDNANLQKAKLRMTFLKRAKLRNANLCGAELNLASLEQTELKGAYFGRASVVGVNFSNVDLSEVKGLGTVVHYGPSSIGIDTLYKSGGNIPADFLRGCGVPDDFITFVPSLIDSQQALQFYSCFISYSHKDDDFAKRLYSRMRDAHLRVWFASEDIKGGQKIHEQIDRAIQIHDRILIVLSENSLQSEWVMTEIRKARKAEIRENRQKLFPIRLVTFEKIKEWECFDAESGKDLAIEVREYFIPDFSNWKSHDDFEAAFNRLLSDLLGAESAQ